jgi:glycine cleavage system regulatory protein
MRDAKELTLRIADRFGLLAEITSALWRKGVNIHAFSAEWRAHFRTKACLL